MKTALISLALIVVVGVGLGAYLDWFDLTSRNDEGQADVTLTVDKDKIETDKDRVMDTVRDTGTEKTAAETSEAQD